MSNPHLCIELAAAGLTFAAEVLEHADEPRKELDAIRLALAGVDGYLLACRRYSRSMPLELREQVATECGHLRGLEDDLVKRMNELLTRAERDREGMAVAS